MSKQFVWLGETCITRNKHPLKHGETYDAKDFDEAVLKYWIKCGDAELVSSKPTKGGSD